MRKLEGVGTIGHVQRVGNIQEDTPLRGVVHSHQKTFSALTHPLRL